MAAITDLNRNAVSGGAAGEGEPRAATAWYDEPARVVMVEMKNGCRFGFPPALVPGLQEGTPAQLAAVEVWEDGEVLHWEALDADADLNGLMLHAFNVKAWAARYLGSATSEAKARAARENGKKGGRPRGKAAPG
ncbi:MAG TPA: DUF2442 domain-containing protein [Longimicrobium sp.]|jgi:hypothetical protein|uniref:DUF2442 domain-containing protein n=1 Tax=Longimicrobium sp. TaxID=2029185 RepID=UPI002ED9709E